MSKTGKCICGAVSVEAEPFPTSQACHCGTCRTWGAGPFMAAPCRTASFTGPVTRFRSSDGAERGFCTTCGTHLFFHALEKDVYAVPVDLFDDGSDLPFKAQIYVDEKPDRYAFADRTRMMTGAEFAALMRGG